jgi:hypothetical protein
MVGRVAEPVARGTNHAPVARPLCWRHARRRLRTDPPRVACSDVGRHAAKTRVREKQDAPAVRDALAAHRARFVQRLGARNLVRAGVPQTVAMKLTGHKTDSVFRRYDIVSPDDLRVAVERLDSAVAG